VDIRYWVRAREPLLAPTLLPPLLPQRVNNSQVPHERAVLRMAKPPWDLLPFLEIMGVHWRRTTGALAHFRKETTTTLGTAARISGKLTTWRVVSAPMTTKTTTTLML